MITAVSFRGNVLAIDDVALHTDYPIEDAFVSGDRVIVLYDPDANLKDFGQVPNLVALSAYGKLLWTAELPTTQTGDCYMEIDSREPLRAWSLTSHLCTIDSSNGRILHREFHK